MKNININKHFSNDKAIFEADLEALKLAVQLKKKVRANTDFLAFHHGVTNSIRRSHVRLLDRLEPDFLNSLIQKWGSLYLKYFTFLLVRHPRQKGSLSVDKAVELEGLGLTDKGLSCLPTASRYAEYWAESSVHDEVIYKQWQYRLDYIGSDEFVSLHCLRESDEILVYDRKGLALPIFDISQVLRLANQQNLWRTFLARETHLVRLSETGSRTLEKLFGNTVPHPGEVRAMVIWTRRVYSLLLSAILFTSGRKGVVGSGYIISDSPPEVYLIDKTDADHAYFIMQSLRSVNEFRRIVFHKDLTEAASAVFPNQRKLSLEDSDSFSFMLTALKAANHSDACCRTFTDYYCLDEWFFRGEDYSYRHLKAPL